MPDFLYDVDYLSLLSWAVAFCVGGLLAMAITVYFLSEDYFVRSDIAPAFRRHPLLLMLANLTGVLLSLLGLIFLLVPGPGVLTLFIGVSLIQNRRKHAILVKLGRRPGVQRSINGLRHRLGRTPMRFPGEDTPT